MGGLLTILRIQRPLAEICAVLSVILVSVIAVVCCYYFCSQSISDNEGEEKID